MAAALGLAGVAVAAPAGASNDPRFNEQWGLSLIGAPAAWEVGTGAGITIAVVDTGVDFGHPDLQEGKVLTGRNFVDPTKSAQDDNGHGTHVAGIAAAATHNEVGVAGTAPGARILPVKVLDGRGSGTTANVAAGIRWAADQGAQVINLSLEPSFGILSGLLGGGSSPEIEDAVNDAWERRRAVVVLAAGNTDLFSSEPAYANLNALVVTGTTRQDQKGGYAEPVGSAKWGIAAPGGAGGSNAADDILSTFSSNSYKHLYGTSMATPHVAGAAAVLRGQGLSPQETVDRLLGTAKDLGAAGRDSTYGAGRLDLACAAGCGGSATGSAGAGSTTASPGTQPAPATSGSGGSSGAGGGSPGPAGSGASSGSTGNAAQVPSEGGRTGSTATGPAGTNTRTTGSRAPGSNGPAGTAPSVSPSPAPSKAVSGDPAGVSDPGAPASDAGAEADLGATATGDPGPSVSLAAGRAVAGEKRPSAVLTGAAGGLLLLVAFSGLGLRRRRPPRPG